MFGLVGFAGVVIGMRSYPLERDALGWSKTFGTLQDARLGADGRIAVQYTFVVGGIKYFGNKRSVVDYGGKKFILEGDAERLMEEQQGNGGVDVYYDPANPERSSLQIGTAGSIVHVAIGCAAILLAACLLYTAMLGRTRE